MRVGLAPGLREAASYLPPHRPSDSWSSRDGPSRPGSREGRSIPHPRVMAGVGTWGIGDRLVSKAGLGEAVLPEPDFSYAN